MVAAGGAIMTEAAIREKVEHWAKAISEKDIDGVMSLYAPHIVSFDLDPPFRYSGAENKRRAWEKFFQVHAGAVSYGVDELSIVVEADTAFVHSLNHVKGEQPSGVVNELWVRWTACFRRVAGEWLVVHDHASVPVDVAKGQALLHLKP